MTQSSHLFLIQTWWAWRKWCLLALINPAVRFVFRFYTQVKENLFLLSAVTQSRQWFITGCRRISHRLWLLLTLYSSYGIWLIHLTVKPRFLAWGSLCLESAAPKRILRLISSSKRPIRLNVYVNGCLSFTWPQLGSTPSSPRAATATSRRQWINEWMLIHEFEVAFSISAMCRRPTCVLQHIHSLRNELHTWHSTILFTVEVVFLYLPTTRALKHLRSIYDNREIQGSTRESQTQTGTDPLSSFPVSS